MYLTGLARVARDAGLVVREVPGWKTRTAHKGGMTKVVGVIWHHTATPAASVVGRNNPTTQYMTNGLGYPLANYGLAWDGSLDVIAAGTGAHAGKGSYKGITDGNRHFIGVEVEGTIGLTWSPAQLETAARLGAALNRDFGQDLIHIGHYEWAPGRKTDPTGIPGMMPALRTAIKRGSWSAPITVQKASTITKTTTKPARTLEDTMAKLDTEDLNNIRKIVREESGANGVDNRKTTAWWKVNGKQQANTKTRYEQELRAVLDAVAAKVGVSSQEISEIHHAIIKDEEAN